MDAVRTDGQRRSDNFEDRGRGSGGGGGGGGGVPVRLLVGLVQLLGFKGTVIAVGLLGVGYFVMPDGLRQALFSVVTGAPAAPSRPSGGGSVCAASPTNGAACDFSRVVLASTEDVWAPLFARGALPTSNPPKTYQAPTLVVFADGVTTGGCGGATSAVGPFYCPADNKLYIDPSFYQVMEKRLRAPGDFAQAYVIAHEVGHHVQNLIGSKRGARAGETKNQTSVRVELQADCFAGVWGHAARASLEITDEDLREALTAAHAIGDDALGHADERAFTHGSSAQRQRWFRTGFEGGDPKRCDTFAVASYDQL